MGMTGHYGPEEWWYPDGTSAANVRAAVFEGDQSTLASIFTDAALTTPLANPTTTDGSGMLEFYAADGNYWIFVGDENYGDSVLANLSPPVTGTGGALLISNNLSDLSNVVTARSNLGLGTAALANTGVGPTNVFLGNDARLTDSRTPTAHAATHGALGSDPVTLAESQVTNLVADLAAKQPIDADLTAIAALTPANDDIIQRKAGAWTNRTVAQYKTDLAITAADVGAQPIATIDAKGDLYAGTGDNATTRRSVGADGEVLVADSGDPTGLSWASVGTDPTAQSRLVIDAKGDLYAGTGNDATTRLPVGTDGQALRANSATATGLEWDTLTAGDVGADPAGSAAAAAAASQPLSTIDVKGDLYAGTANNTTARRSVGVDGTVLTALASDPTGLTWTALSAADVGAVPTTRILTAGIALSGGGDLSADRTFDVDLGTSAGTAAEGNDSRITGAQQRSALTTLGDLYVATASGVTTRLGAGADGEILSANSTEPTGLEWITGGSGGIPATIFDAKGDLIAASAADTAARLPVGSNGQALRANSATSTGLEWDTLDAADVGADVAGAAAAAQAASQPLDSDLTTIAGLTPTNDDVMQYKAGAWANRTIAQVKTDLAYTAAQVGAIPNTLVDAKGDIITATADNTPARLPVGTDGQVLSANSAQSTGLEWVAAGGGGIPATIFDAKGDIIAASAADTAARLAVGSNGQALRANSATSTGLEWDTIDAADVGAIASTLPDAKGDLITATAADTPARLAVGTNGLVLTADSTTSTGLKWEIAKTVGMYPRSTGFIPTGGVVTARSSKAATLNALFYIPFVTLADATLSVITWEITGNVATAVVRLGIYGHDSAMLPSGAAVADYGQTASDTIGVKTAAVSTALAAGLWYLAFVAQVAAPTTRHCAGFSPFVTSTTFPSGTGLGWNNAWVQLGVSGTLPTVGSIVDTDSPLCGIKF